jgi:predicted nuclease of predicted toxin-antitoxin system
MIAIIDEDLPRKLGESLKKLGWETKDVRDFGLSGKTDKEIISFAKESKAVLFSSDKDFANISKYPPQEYYGIVILDFPNEVSTDFMIKETGKALVKIPLEDFKHNLIIIEPGKIRIRRGKNEKSGNSQYFL